MRRAYALLPHIKITELLLEVECMDELQSTLHPLKDW